MRIALMAFALLQATTSAALAADWTVSRVSGRAVLSGGGAGVAVVTGMTVQDGQALSTGPNGRVRLQRGQESILVGPNTVITPREGWFGTTRIDQQAGRIELEVDKRNVPHFSVETPLLAAVVKGTRFVVEVGARSERVQVSRGAVQVHDRRTGQTADLIPGQSARTASQSGGLQVAGPKGQPVAVQGGWPFAAGYAAASGSIERAEHGSRGSGPTGFGSRNDGGFAAGGSGSLPGSLTGIGSDRGSQDDHLGASGSGTAGPGSGGPGSNGGGKGSGDKPSKDDKGSGDKPSKDDKGSGDKPSKDDKGSGDKPSKDDKGTSDGDDKKR